MSQIPAELFAIDIVLQKVKGNEETFEWTKVIAHGDCFQQPNITG